MEKKRSFDFVQPYLGLRLSSFALFVYSTFPIPVGNRSIVVFEKNQSVLIGNTKYNQSVSTYTDRFFLKKLLPIDYRLVMGILSLLALYVLIVNKHKTVLQINLK